MRATIVYATCAMACLFALPANAYIDPGSGSMAIQMIVGGILAAAFMIKTYYFQLKRWIARLFGRDSGHEVDGSSEETIQSAADNSADAKNDI
jgi:hypothetical protein